MRIYILFLMFLGISVTGCSQKTKKEYVPLFNDKDLTGWVMPGKVPGFEVTDGIMVGEPPGGSDIFTEEEFANYHFKFEYLLSEVGNSGVLIRCKPENPWGTGVEIQLLAPWTPYRDDLHCTGSLYGHVAVTSRPDETTGIWHEMEIIYDREFITILVDGKVTTEARVDTVETMKGKLRSGAIGFQSNHSNKGEFVHFRNISIRNLDLEPDYVAKGFYYQDSVFRKQAMDFAESIGIPIVKYLAEIADEQNPEASSAAKQILFNMMAKATAPDGSKKDLKKLKKAYKSALKNTGSEPAKHHLKWLLEMADI